MQSAEAVAAKRRVLVQALTMCLSRSKVKDIVPMESIRTILESASGELWREGEFRLEMVWKILCQQPGLSAKEVAPPLLVFKAFENELGVNVRIPEALSAIPRADQDQLRNELDLKKEDFAAAIEEMKKLPAPETPRADMGEVAQRAANAQVEAPRARKGPSKKQAILAAVLGSIATVAIGVSLWLTLRDTASSDDLSDVAPILQLANGHRVDKTLAARINDARWDTLGADEQKRIATQLFDREVQKGVHILVLTDEKGRVRVGASDSTGRVVISVH
jgi:negative regulator of sigma E activity